MSTPLPEVEAANVGAQAWAALQARLAPGRLRETAENVDVLLGWAGKKYKLQGVNAQQLLTVMYEATEALYFQHVLDWEKRPSPQFHDKMVQAYQAAFTAKEKSRIEREKLENSKPFDFDARTKAVEADKAKKEHEKRQKTAQAMIDNFVSNFTVNASYPGAIDHGMSSACRKAFNGIKVNRRDGKYDAELTWTVIQGCARCESPKAIIQTAEKILEQMNAPKVSRGRDSFGEL